MSLILEALRKSEAERRRGQVPDLHTEPSPGALPRRDGPPAWLWLALALATALVLAMALWLMRSVTWEPSTDGEMPPSATTAVDAESNRERQAGLPVAHVDAALVMSEPVAGADLATTPLARGSSVPDSEPAPPPARGGEGREMPGASTLAASSAAAPAAATLSPSHRVADATASAALATRAPSTTPSAPPPTAAPARVPVAAATAPTATMAAATPSAASSEPQRLSDLPVDQRRQLPPLKMSMHMWAPTQRFAIIDGARVSEGDRVGAAVVEAITADGVVLAWQGQRLHLPTR